MDRQELLQTFVLASEFKEGDLLVGGSLDARQREDARASLAALKLGEIRKQVFVEDGVSETLQRSLNARLAAEISHLTIGRLKSILLGADGSGWAQRYRDGLSSEMIAAAAAPPRRRRASCRCVRGAACLPGRGAC